MKTLLFGSLTVLLAIIAASPARADCYPASRLDSEYGNCLSNGRYVDAGIACFTNLESMIKAKAKAAGQQMANSNQQNVMGNKNSQTSDFTGTSADYQISDAALDYLIKVAKASRSSIDSYLDNIYFPDDFDAPPAVIGNAVDYINSSPCYAEPRDMLEDMLDRTDNYIAQLTAAKKAGLALKASSTNRDTSLSDSNNGSMGNPAVGATRGLGSATPPTYRPTTNPDSTVTGLKNDQKKQQQQP